MHKTIHERRITGMGQSFRDKTIVMGVLERGGEVRTEVVPDRLKHTLQPIVRKHVESGARCLTDEMGGYKGLSRIRPSDHQSCRRVRNGRGPHQRHRELLVLAKAGLNGTYISVEPFHLFRYLDEQAFRYNNRATKKNPLTDKDRFSRVVSQISGKDSPLPN